MKSKKISKTLTLNKKTIAHLNAKDLTAINGGTGTQGCTDTCDYCSIKSCIICRITENPVQCPTTIQP